MSLLAARTYFRSYMDSLGYHEWTDAFNVENIPSTLINDAYHIESGTISGESLNQNDQVLNCLVIVRLFKKGYLKPSKALDEMQDEVQIILESVLKRVNRGAQPPTNVILNDINYAELSVSNDNLIVAEMTFTVRINLGID